MSTTDQPGVAGVEAEVGVPGIAGATDVDAGLYNVSAEHGDRQAQAAAPALEGGASAALLTDATGRIISANGAAAAMLGYSEAELLSLSLGDIDPSLGLERLRQVNGALLTQGVLRFESIARHRGGHAIPVEVTHCAMDGRQPAELVALSILTDITERKRAEAELERHRCDLEALVEARTAELAEALSRLQTATAAAELGFWELDLTDQSTTWDERSFEIFGFPEPARRPTPDLDLWLALVHPEDRPIIEARLPQVGETIGPFRYGHRIVRPDGAVRHISATGQVVRDEQGAPRRIVGFNQDVTEAVEAELALRRSEERLQNILYGTDAGTWEWNVRTDAVVLNERWATMLGWTLAELAPHSIDTWKRLTHPDDLREAMARLARCRGREAPLYECELRMRHRDGHWVWVLDKGRVVEWGADGEAVRMAGIHLEISDRKCAEQALARQEERFRRFFEDNGSVMVMIDPDSRRIEAANQAAVAFYGYPAERLVGMCIDDINTLPSAALAARVQEIRANRLAVFRSSHRLGSGEVREVRVYSSLIQVDDRTLLFSIIHDETARVRAEAELREAKEAAEAMALAKGRFLAQMSHEIRTPMNGVLGLAELALHRPLEPVARGYLEKLLRSGRSLLGILNDILDQSRIDAGHLQLQHAPFDVQELLGGLLDLFGELAAEKGLRLHVCAADDAPRHLLGDALRVRQVLANLIGNAIKFTEHGEIRLQVTCLGVQDGVARVRWAVTDTGPGIDAASRARLFTPFAQGDESISRRYGGTGLGLSISRGLVDIMGGRLSVDSTLGAGSSFVVELPLAVAAAPAPSATQHSAPADLRGVRVLVAEDHPINRQVLADMLALLGVQATLVVNGKEALDALERACFDAVLMDIQMPEMDGLTAIARLRERPGGGALPVIAITAGVTEAERAHVAAVGANELLAKPVSLETLVDALLRWLPAGSAAPAARPDGEQPRPAAPAGASAAPLPALPALTGFDMQRLQKTIGRQRVEVFVQLFAESTGDDMAALERALDAGDRAAARRALHSLRGACAFAGALALDDSALSLADTLKQGQPAAGPLAALRQAYHDAGAALASLLPSAAGDGA
ncbi:PAS domain S-box protein [Thiohalocapsa sp. ML1]|uniref:PAS domain S-box protein n=1 Tax=Thiohalocapsa sp. ML1 TaxID=1431688 RepID=UPI000732172C|nr:PAS domain S-box protein [Thiohalocapsa sp. ML1]